MAVCYWRPSDSQPRRCAVNRWRQTAAIMMKVMPGLCSLTTMLSGGRARMGICRPLCSLHGLLYITALAEGDYSI